MASTEFRKFSVKQQLRQRQLWLGVIIAVLADVCFFFLLRHPPGPNGYVGVQVLFLVLMSAYINSAGFWAAKLLFPISADSRPKQPDQVSI